MKLKYNAPTTLTFTLIAVTVLLTDLYIMPGTIEALFTAEGSLTFLMDNIPAYVRLLTHVFGHAGWDHLLSNITLILLIGPILEEKYGSKSLTWMIIITALVNGLVNAFFFESSLMGASGVAFMMILMVSFANIKAGEFPISAVLVVVLYLFKEFLAIFRYDDVSQISHIVGSACGAFFGYRRTVSHRGSVPITPGRPVAGGQQTIG